MYAKPSGSCTWVIFASCDWLFLNPPVYVNNCSICDAKLDPIGYCRILSQLEARIFE